VLHFPFAAELVDDQQRIGSHVHDVRVERGRRFEARDDRAVLGDVVRRDADRLAHFCEPERRITRGIEHDRADRGRARVAARPAVGKHGYLGDDVPFRPERQRLLVHAGTSMQPQLSQ
jgi:hypothetical protein